MEHLLVDEIVLKLVGDPLCLRLGLIPPELVLENHVNQLRSISLRPNHILEAVPLLNWFGLALFDQFLLFLLKVLKDVPVLETHLFLAFTKVRVNTDHVVEHGLETLELELSILFLLGLVEGGLLLLLLLSPPAVLLNLLAPVPPEKFG